MSIPLRFEARRDRLVNEQQIWIEPMVQDRATFQVVKDGSRFSVWFHWNSTEPLLFLDRMTHLSTVRMMIAEGRRRLGPKVLITVDNPFTMDRNRKYL